MNACLALLPQKNNIDLQVNAKTKNGENLPTTFKELQRETTVYKYYVELKEDVLTKQGYLDLAKMPNLYISGAGRFLRKLRLENGLIRKDIAKLARVSLSQVSHWENNDRRMPLKSLIKIAETLDVSRGTIYSLIDQGKFHTKHNLPVKFDRIRNIIQYFSPHIDNDCARITLLNCCPNETLLKIEETLNVKMRTYENWKMITCRELYNFFTTFFRYTKVPKIRPPLTTEVKEWYYDNVDLKRAVIIPCLQTDGDVQQLDCDFIVGLVGKNEVLHDYFVDSIYYEYNELPSTYLGCRNSNVYRTEYYKKSMKKIFDDVIDLAGNAKTSPAKKQAIEKYLQEPQPHLNYLINASRTEQQIALRIWSSTEGSISVIRNRGYVYPYLEIACTHPDLAKQLQKIARRLNINFHINHKKDKWSGIHGLFTSALNSCLEFLKLGSFIKGVKISSKSKYHEGIDKDVLLLGILEYKKQELENRDLKKLEIHKTHHKINEIIKNRGYRSAEYYISSFS